MSTILNPAGLAWTTKVRADLGVSMTHHEENRFMPVFDSFESYVTDMAIASNQNTWLGTGFAVAVPLSVLDFPLAVGLSLADRYPYDYTFEEEFRDPDTFSSPRDRILEERAYEVDGTLRTLSFGFATAALNDRVSAGASLHYAFGTREESWLLRDNDLDDGDQSYDNRQEWDLSGVNATFGVQGKVTDRLTLGVAYETRLEVDGDYDVTTFAAGDEAPVQTTTTETIKYPAFWRFGAAFYPRSEPRTVLTVDVVYSDWEDLEDSREGDREILNDVIDVRVGLEHTFHNDMRMRFGFRRYDSYADEEGGNSVFSGGAGFPVAGGEVSLSLELNKLQSYETHVFGYPGDPYVADDIARVDDSRVRIGIGWSREF